MLTEENVFDEPILIGKGKYPGNITMGNNKIAIILQVPGTNGSVSKQFLTPNVARWIADMLNRTADQIDPTEDSK